MEKAKIGNNYQYLHIGMCQYMTSNISAASAWLTLQTKTKRKKYLLILGAFF